MAWQYPRHFASKSTLLTICQNRMPKIQLFLLVSEVLLFKMVRCERLLYAKLQGSHGPSLYVLPYTVLQATDYSQMIKVPIQNKNKKPKKEGLALSGNFVLRQTHET